MLALGPKLAPPTTGVLGILRLRKQVQIEWKGLPLGSDAGGLHLVAVCPRSIP